MDCLIFLTTPENDRRHERRLDVRRPCRISLAEVKSGEIAGITNDISRSGMLVTLPDARTTAALPKVGQPARIVIELPRSPNTPPRCFEYMARVVRVADPGAEGPSVAFEIQRIRIRVREDDSSRQAALLRRAPLPACIQ